MRWLSALLLFIAGAVASPSQAAAESAPFCADGQLPHFAFGLADLKVAIGEAMGDPLECEHADSANGDTLQQTTKGLAMYHHVSNTPEFTDGWNHWALSDDGLSAWSGAPLDQAVTPEPTAPPVWGAPPNPGAPSVARPARPVASPPTSPQPSPPSASQCVDAGAGACLNTVPELADTLVLLAKTSSGAPLMRAAGKAGYMVHFGDLPVDVLGMFRPSKHEIVMSSALKPFPALDRAPVLAHELQHVSDWLAHAAQLQTQPGCLATEINAFHTESSTWLELQGGRLKSASNDLEREFNMITQAIATDPKDFESRLSVVYHDECVANSSGRG